jgi:hypothetical protein
MPDSPKAVSPGKNKKTADTARNQLTDMEGLPYVSRMIRPVVVS